MSDYVNKVQKEGVDYDIHDERIAALSDIAGLDGNSLVIPEQERPEPVITIDGVAYYYKQEFDLEELLQLVIDGQSGYLDILTGKSKDNNYPSIHYYQSWQRCVELRVSTSYVPYLLGESTSSYTSHAFTVVDTQDEVTDATKICLPTCSAYYGFLSEDGKTFISYYNLKSEVPEYIDSIKQGNAVIPLKAVSGTKLYKHEMMPAGEGEIFSVITTKSEPYTYNDFESLNESSVQNLCKSWIAVSNMFVTLGWNIGSRRVKMIKSFVSESDGTLNATVMQFSSFSQTGFVDTVTAL